MNEAGRKIGLVVMLPMAVTSPQGESRVTFIIGTKVLITERRKVLAKTLTFHVGAVGGVREAAWIKEPRACCSIFIKTGTMNEEIIEPLKIVDYSEKAIAVIGETKAHKDKLKELGGRFAPGLTCGQGWIFSKKKTEASGGLCEVVRWRQGETIIDVLTMTYEELNRTIAIVASQVKLAVGIGNNAAWAAVLEAHDHIRQHRNYRHEVKRLYKQALQEFHDYEARLIHAQKNRMFRISDMSANTRKKYGNITDREYYDFWTATGATAYAQTRTFVTNLHNKYRISLEAHGVRQPEILAWAMTADACLKIAKQIYTVTLQVMEDVFKVRRKMLIEVFGQFDLSRVIACWQTAMRSTDKGAFDYDMTDIERKNIEHAIDDLIDRWSDTQKHLRITNETMKDYDDIFRTKGELKKAQRELSELEQELKEDEDKRNYERRERKIKLAATADDAG